MLTLIQTSQDRKIELERFIHSLNSQQDIDFNNLQLIFIDQGDNKTSFSKLNKNIKFTYIKYRQCSLSHARNIALKYVEGKYVGFPDDDCWYSPQTLKQVLYHFSNGRNGIIAKGVDETGKMTNRFSSKSQEISLYNHCGAISYTIFLKFDPTLFFDENIGVGSNLGFLSGEESDYLYHFLLQHTNVYYDKNIIVHHPLAKTDYFKNTLDKAYCYAKGYGYILAKNHYPIHYKVMAFLRPLMGIILYAMAFKFNRSKKSYYILKGRLLGYTHHKKYKS